MAVYESKTATKDGRKWYYSVRYKKANGESDREKSKKFLTEAEAHKAERKFLDEVEEKKIDITYEELYEQYINYIEESIKGSSTYTKKSRAKNHILNYFGKMNIHNISSTTVVSWKSEKNKATYSKSKKKYSLQYKQILMAELRTTLTYGMNFCGLKENVAKIIMNFQDKDEEVRADEEKIRYITPAEYRLFTSVIEKILFKVFFAFLYYMGVRKGEAQALNWTDILWETNQVRIIKTVTNKTDELDQFGNRFKITNTKNRKNRKIKMPPIIKYMLLELYYYYSDFEGFNEKWFVFGGHRHLASQTIDNEKERYFDLVKETYGKEINRITNHEFRHSHASYLISQGVSRELIAFRLGDTVDVVEKTYAHLFPEVEDGIVEELELIESSFIIKSDLKIPNTKKEFYESSPAPKILCTVSASGT